MRGSQANTFHALWGLQGLPVEERKNTSVFSAGQKLTQNAAMEQEEAGPSSLRLAQSATFLWRNSSEEDETLIQSPQKDYGSGVIGHLTVQAQLLLGSKRKCHLKGL